MIVVPRKEFNQKAWCLEIYETCRLLIITIRFSRRKERKVLLINLILLVRKNYLRLSTLNLLVQSYLLNRGNNLCWYIFYKYYNRINKIIKNLIIVFILKSVFVCHKLNNSKILSDNLFSYLVLCHIFILKNDKSFLCKLTVKSLRLN